MEIDPSPSDTVRRKSETLRALSTGPVSSSISKLSESSRVLPSEKDFHFYYNFDEFRAPIDEIGSKSQSMLQQIGSSNQLWGGKELGFPQNIEEDGTDWLINANDDVIERFDRSVDEFSKEQEEGVRVDDNGFQLVGGKKKKEESVVSTPVVRVVERDKKTVGSKPKVPFHIPTIKRPQDEYNILVNNTNQPFQHVWLERSEDGSRVIHPLEKLSVLDFVDRNIENLDPVKPPPLDSTPFKPMEEVKDLKDLAAKLRSVNEFAVDLEHNQYRSFQGLTCLMQISTRSEDFVVDTLKLRIHIGPYLREVFKDPNKRKVMHGADRDIAWLQRDFGIYVCNLFDTGQASRVLQMERYSLEHLLQHFCGVAANKQYQNADWRLRPLPEEMIRYAREDTHYLLYIYDLMKIRLLSESTDPENSDALLQEVYKRSYDVCIQLYEKELLTDTSYLHIYGVQGANLNAQQLSIVAGLCEWRDTIARTEDESTGYILPNKTLLEIAKQIPLTTSKLRRVMKSRHPYVERNLNAVVSMIRHSVQNASAFETVAEQLKEGRIQGAPEVGDAAADFPEVHTAGGHSGAASDGCQQERVVGSLLLNKGNYKHMGNDLTRSRGSVSIDIGKNGNLRKDDNIISDAQRLCLSFPSQKNEINATEASVQLLKKPNRAFGALLGSPASKKTADLKKEMGGDQLEQIRSSVNLPFYPFAHLDQQSKQPSKHAPEQQNRASDTMFSGERPAAPALGSDSEDIILLESNQPSNDAPEDSVDAQASSTKSEDVVILLDSDSDDEEPPDNAADDDNHANMINHQEMASKPELVVLDDDDDDDDEPMSLSDLSSSFQKCLQSIDQNQNQTTKHDGKSEEAIPLRFGEEAEKEH